MRERSHDRDERGTGSVTLDVVAVGDRKNEPDSAWGQIEAGFCRMPNLEAGSWVARIRIEGITEEMRRPFDLSSGVTAKIQIDLGR